MTAHCDITLAARNIRLLLLDVDGVLTDGHITYTDSGEEIKSFSVRDGLGIRLLMDAGIQVGIITGRRSEALVCRCRNLGITLLFDGIKNKTEALAAILAQTGCNVLSTAFVGDDLPDLPVIRAVGFGVAVADAAPEVIAAADWVTRAPGGRGAVREVSEILLKSQGLWERITAGFKS